MSTEKPPEYPHEQPVPDNLYFHPTRCDNEIPVVDVLRTAYHRNLKQVIVLGLDENGKESVLTSSPSAPNNIYLCSRAMHLINSCMDEQQADLIVGDED
jgi:hypothetical protein